MKLNTTKLLIAALALCGTCFLSCEKEESFSPEKFAEKILMDENIEIEETVGSFEVAISVKFNNWDPEKLNNCCILIYTTPQDDCEYYSISKSEHVSCYFSDLLPNTTYYYKVGVGVKNDVEVYRKGEFRSFTTAPATLLTSEKTERDITSLSVTGTSATYTLIDTTYKPVVNLYYSTRKTILSADSIKNADYVQITLNGSGVKNECATIKYLNKATEYYICADYAFDKSHSCMSYIISTYTYPFSYTAKAVDLGLSVLWADRNVGAASDTDQGEAFHFGDTIKFNDNYKRVADEDLWTSKDTMYVDCFRDNVVDICGNPKYDAAAAKLGNGWRMPNKEEVEELIEKCTFKRIELIVPDRFDRALLEVTGPNGNTMIVYWAKSIGSYYGVPYWLGIETFKNCPQYFQQKDKLIIGNAYRGYSALIRPVRSK